MTPNRNALGRGLFAALSAGALVLALAGCSDGEAPPEAPDGTWGDPAAERTPSLEFVPGEGASGTDESDAGESGTDESITGEYSGTDGCNGIGGRYSQNDEGVIDLGLMRTTLMACPDVDTWLSEARTATIEGATMTFLDENGETIGSLERAE